MRHNEKRHSLSALCALLGYSRQAFYQFEKNNNQNCFEAELVIQQVLLHRAQQPRLGTRKLLVLMQDFVREHQLKLGRDALFDLLRAHKLLVKKRRRRVQTTFSNHWQNRTDFYDSNNNGGIKIFIFFPPLDTGINAMD